MTKYLRRICSAILLLCASTLLAQTKIDLRTQTKSVDFTGATATKPARMGATLPATCNQGEFFFLSSAPAGQNVYGCAAANSWALEGAAIPQTSLVPSSLNNSGKLLTTDGANPTWQTINGDVTGTPSTLKVGALLGRALSTVAPVDGQLLKFNNTSGKWEPAGLTGDVSGSSTATQVTALRGWGLSAANPGDGQLLKFNGTTKNWEPISLGGDITGNPASSTVTALRGWGISAATPNDGQLLKFNGTTKNWEPVALGGDLNGNPATATVTALRGRALSTAAPGDGQLLKFNGTSGAWEPVAIAGDVSGAPAALTVSALQGRSVSSTAPGTGQLMAWNSTSNAWTPTTMLVPPNFAVTFTSLTSLTIPGTQHGLNTANLIATCYDTSTPPTLIEPGRVTVDPATYNVTITFATAQSGRCVVNGSAGGGLGATTLTGSAPLTFAAISNASCSADQSFTLTGAVPGSSVQPGWPALPAGLLGIMRVSAADTVAVRICNLSGASTALSSMTYGATIVRAF